MEWDITLGTDGPKRIFRGELEDALEIPVVRSSFSILVALFGGLYITSNVAESLFNVKPALKSHRASRAGRFRPAPALPLDEGEEMG